MRYLWASSFFTNWAKLRQIDAKKENVEKQFIWRSSSINYQEFGTGSNLLIAFHGYGQDSSVFQVFDESLGNKYRVVSVDLPYQGKTIWGEDHELNRRDLLELIDDFLIHLGHQDKVSLLGYSIGGNYALGFTIARPEIIDELWLIAADGLTPRIWFRFITKTTLGRFLFQRFILNPSRIIYTLNIAGKLGILARRTVAFYKSTIDTKLKRKELFLRWRSSARIAPDVSTSRNVLNGYRIKTHLIYGKRDSVISYQAAVKFSDSVATSDLYLVDKGHRLLVPNTNATINAILDSKD